MRIKLTRRGVSRVLNGHVGQEFEARGPVTPNIDPGKQPLVEIHDARYQQIWSLGHGDYEVIEGWPELWYAILATVAYHGFLRETGYSDIPGRRYYFIAGNEIARLEYYASLLQEEPCVN